MAAKSKSSAAVAPDETLAAPAPQEGRRPRPGVPAWALGLAGGVAAGGYGATVESMRFGPPLVMMALGGMTLVLSAVALWRVIDPLSGGGVPAGAGTAQAPQRLRELDREKQLVLKAIKEIELDYQMRKIAEADYREMIERYRARAMRLISEIEAGDNYRELIERELKDRLAAALARDGALAAAAAAAAPAPVAAATPVAAPPAAAAGPPTCSSCHTTNDDDAQFCKKCGSKLATS